MQAIKERTSVTGVNYQEKMNSIMNMLEEGIKAVFSSDRYLEYLSMMSKFHNYSFRNTLLILMQRPDASHVAGFHQWRNVFERSVNKGETGLKILAPYSITKEILSDKRDNKGSIIIDPITGKGVKEVDKIQTQSFKIVTVFDVSQTSGKPLPELVSELKANIDKADEFEIAIRKIAACPIITKSISSAAKGYYSPRENIIVIREGMSSLQTIKTMVHELVHSRLHGKDRTQKKDHSTMEVEAESVAFIVLQFLGIDTSDYSFAYLASWSESQELKELSSSLSVIQKESDELIKLLSKELL